MRRHYCAMLIPPCSKPRKRDATVSSFAEGNLIGFEALVRWRHATLGMVPAERFVPLAEETGLIISLGEQVLRIACKQFSVWHDAGLEPGMIAVNLSTKQFRDKNLLSSVSKIIHDTGCRPACVELEVTESFAMNRPEDSIATMKQLRKLGMDLAIDDFGTGYSSMTYLKKLPISKLKIDRSFISGIPHDANDLAITRATIALGKTLGLRIIAEGVETVEQEAMLRAEGCDEAQGYYYGKPMSAEDATALLRKA